MIYRIFCWSLATFWLGSRRNLHALQRQTSMLCGHVSVSLSPLNPIFLPPRCIHCHAASRHPLFGVVSCAAKAVLRSTFNGKRWWFYFHNNNYSTRRLSVIVLRGNQNLHFENTGRIPVCSCSALCGKITHSWLCLAAKS